MSDRIYTAFLIIALTAILFLLPVPDAIHDFVTNPETETSAVITAVAENTTALTLTEPLYNNQYNLVTVASTLAGDTLLVTAYNSTTQNITIAGLVENTTRTITTDYLVYTLTGGSAIEKFTGYLPLLWILICVAFPVAALVTIVKNWSR